MENNKFDELQKIRQDELEKIKDLERQLYEAKNNQNWRIYIKDIYENILFEDDLFILKACYDVHHGFNVSFENKTPKYNVYDVFESFSFFNEWFKSIHDSAQLIRPCVYPELKNDFSNVETVIEEIDNYLNDKYVLKRYESLFRFVSEQVKIMLGDE